MKEFDFAQSSNFTTATNKICKNCKHNRGHYLSAFCEKYRAGDFNGGKPKEVAFAPGRGKCKYYEEE